MCEIRKRGVSAAVICSEPFVKLAKTQAKVFGVPDLALIVIPHPLGGLEMSGVKSRVDVANPQLLALIRQISK
jgi:hypothetical protein